MNTDMITLIYALRDDHWIRYVGKTVNALEWRLARHLKAARDGEDSHKGRGIRKMLQEGRLPTITLITVANGRGDKEEQNWIAYFKSYGIDLWNMTEGGEGGVRTGEAKKRHLESFQRPGVRAQMSNSARKRAPASAETCKKKGDASRGLKRSEETLKRMRIAQKRAANTPEGRATRSAINKGRVHTPESREVARINQTGKKDSPETLKRKRIAQTISQSRPEVREKIRISVKATWAARKNLREKGV